MSTPLKVAVQGYASLKERLLAQYPDLSETDEALLGTLEGETDLQEQIVAVIRSTVEDEANVEALAQIIAQMTDRKRRLAERARNKRAAVAEAMAETGLKKITAPDFTLSQSYTRPGVIVTDETQLPSWALRTKTVTEPDKDAIRNALAQGPVPGAAFSNSHPTVQVRTA